VGSAHTRARACAQEFHDSDVIIRKGDQVGGFSMALELLHCLAYVCDGAHATVPRVRRATRSTLSSRAT
jgi:hypothetical protein